MTSHTLPSVSSSTSPVAKSNVDTTPPKKCADKASQPQFPPFFRPKNSSQVDGYSPGLKKLIRSSETAAHLWRSLGSLAFGHGIRPTSAQIKELASTKDGVKKVFTQVLAGRGLIGSTLIFTAITSGLIIGTASGLVLSAPVGFLSLAGAWVGLIKISPSEIASNAAKIIGTNTLWTGILLCLIADFATDIARAVLVNGIAAGIERIGRGAADAMNQLPSRKAPSNVPAGA